MSWEISPSQHPALPPAALAGSWSPPSQSSLTPAAQACSQSPVGLSFSFHVPRLLSFPHPQSHHIQQGFTLRRLRSRHWTRYGTRK